MFEENRRESRKHSEPVNGSNGNGHDAHRPEVMPDDFKLTTPVATLAGSLATQGFLPTERQRVRAELEAARQRIMAANDRVIRVVTAEAEFSETVAEQAEEQYRQTVAFHRSLGS